MDSISNHVRLALGVERYRFLQMGFGVWGASLVASGYAFGLISHKMKEEFGMSQQQLAIVTTVTGVIGNFCFPAGFTFDLRGPRTVVAVAMMMCSLGFLLYGLVFSRIIPFRFELLIVSAVLTSFCGWFDIGTLMPNLFNFPHDRGMVVVMQKTFMGLGASVLSIFFSAFFPHSTAGYCFFVAALMAGFGLSCFLFINLPEYEYERRRVGGQQLKAVTDVDRHLLLIRATKWRAKLGYGLLVFALVFLTGASIFIAVANPPQWVATLLGWITVILMFSFLLMGLLPASKHDSIGAPSTTVAPLLPSEAIQVEETDDPSPKHLQNDDTFLVALRRIDLWLLWWLTFAVWGSVMIVMWNEPQIYRALNGNSYSASINRMYIGIIGVASALGRICTGFIEGELVKRRKSITVMFAIPPAMNVVAFALYFVVPANAIGVPYFVSSFGFGMSWAVVVLAMRMMNSRDVGKKYNFLFTGPMIAIIAFNRFLVGYLYDEHGREQGLYPNCSGIACFRAAFLLFLGLNCVGVMTGYVAHRRWMGNFFTKHVEVVKTPA